MPRVLVKISTPERMRVAYLKDLSEGGVFIRTDKPLQLERVVDVDLLAPGRVDPIRLRGRITRVQNDEASKVANLQGMGVKFIELTAQADAALRSLVQEYSQPQAAPPASQVPDANTVALKQAIETADVLRTTLIERDEELQKENARREELAARVLQLTEELEGARTRGNDGQSIALEALKVELNAARAEVGELKSRVAQAEGNAEAYRQEIAVLEEDDAATRRLAETLAQAKQKVEAELKRTREELALKHATLEAEKQSASARSAESAKVLEAERARRIELEKKLEQLAAQNASLHGRTKEMEPMLEQARKHVSGMGQAMSELAAAKARIDTLEKALSEEKQKSTRLANRERELRQLVAAISAKGDDVVVMDDGIQQTVESTAAPTPVPPPAATAPAPAVAPEAMSPSASEIGAAIGDAIGAALGTDDGYVRGSTMIMTRMPELANAGPPPGSLDPFSDQPSKPGQTLVMMTMPEGEEEAADEPAVAGVELEDAPLPPAPEAPPPAEIESLPVDVDAVDVDMETDWGGQATPVEPSPGQEQFLERLRANDKLVRRPSFFEYAAADQDEEHVIGSLMGGDRYEDLKVLSRGQCTAEQLESHLLKFHQLGLIGFDA